MNLEPYLLLSGVEVSNALRTLTYLRRGLGGPNWNVAVTGAGVSPETLACYCSTMDPGTGFVSPAADPAPWYDAARPESADFLGLLADISLVGPARRTVSPRALGGGSIGPLRVGHRLIQVTGTIVAASKAGMGFGERWLNRVLAGALDGCAGDVAEVLPYCTDSDDALRELEPVGLIDPPTFSAPPQRQVCHLQGVAFQLAAGSGFLRFASTLRATQALGAVELCNTMAPSAIAVAAARITIVAGGTILDNVVIRGQAGSCPITGTADFTATVESLPAGATLVVDGSLETVTVTNASGDVVGGLNFLSFTGLFEWLRGGVGDDYCVCVNPAAATGTAGATITIDQVELEL